MTYFSPTLLSRPYCVFIELRTLNGILNWTSIDTVVTPPSCARYLVGLIQQAHSESDMAKTAKYFRGETGWFSISPRTQHPASLTYLEISCIPRYLQPEFRNLSGAIESTGCYLNLQAISTGCYFSSTQYNWDTTRLAKVLHLPATVMIHICIVSGVFA